MGIMISAFAGAFFAFLFTRIGIALDRMWEREKNFYSALVGLEYRLNMLLDEINNNSFVIKSINKILSIITDQGKIPIAYNKLHQIQVDKGVLLKLQNIDLVNDMFSYFIDIDKLNNDVETSNYLYQEIKSALFNALIDINVYKINVIHYIKQLNKLNQYLSSFEKKTKDRLVKVRLLLEDKPIFVRFVQKFFTKKHYSKELIERIPEELEKLNKEIEITKKKSEEELREIFDS